MVLADVRSGNSPLVYYAAFGGGGLPSVSCQSGSVYDAVISAAPGVPLVPGEQVDTCYRNGSGRDEFVVTGAAGTAYPMCGDASIGGNTTTLFWVRSAPP
jgi:hypothetical protein